MPEPEIIPGTSPRLGPIVLSVTSSISERLSQSEFPGKNHFRNIVASIGQIQSHIYCRKNIGNLSKTRTRICVLNF